MVTVAELSRLNFLTSKLRIKFSESIVRVQEMHRDFLNKCKDLDTVKSAQVDAEDEFDENIDEAESNLSTLNIEKVEKSRFVSKVFWLFVLIFWALEVQDRSQIVDLVEIYRSKFLLFIFVPWASCLRSKYMIF